MRIAIDAMGGDHAPGEIVAGALQAVREAGDLELFLVGREDAIRQSMKKDDDLNRVTIIHASEVIGNNEEPGLAIRRKKDSSMVAAFELVRTGQADAILSAGNTGALMAGGLLLLGRLAGVSRPALLAEIPVFEGGGVVMMDVGANMDAKPEQLYQYALIGKIYAREVLEKPDPRIALLNVGVEENKGNAQIKKAYQLFVENGNINFIGNLEAEEIFRNRTDIIISDGFAGNVFLKAFEGISRDIFACLQSEILNGLENSAEFSSVLRKLYAKIDVAEYGGAVLIGINGICIKCHGASKARAVTQALLQRAYPFIKNNTNDKIKAELELILKDSPE